MSITSHLQNGIAWLFGTKATEPALTFDNILRNFRFQLQNRIDPSHKPATTYVELDGERMRFERTVHLLFDSAKLQDTDDRHAEFRDKLAGIIDDVYQTHPTVALGVVSGVYRLGMWDVAIAKSMAIRSYHTPADIARHEVEGQRLDALLDATREKLLSLTADFAQKSPEDTLHFFVGHHDTVEYAHIENENHRRINEGMLSNSLSHLCMRVDAIEGLKAIDLESFFEAKPAEVLIASGVLARPDTENDRVEELARYNKFKALAAQHPLADSLQYLTAIIEPSLNLGKRYAKPAENTPNI